MSVCTCIQTHFCFLTERLRVPRCGEFTNMNFTFLCCSRLVQFGHSRSFLPFLYFLKVVMVLINYLILTINSFLHSSLTQSASGIPSLSQRRRPPTRRYYQYYYSPLSLYPPS
eukprot:03555_4